MGHGGHEGHLGVHQEEQAQRGAHHQAGRRLEEGDAGGVAGHAEDGRVRLEAPQVNARAFSLVPESLSGVRGAETWSDRSRRFWHDCGETLAWRAVPRGGVRPRFFSQLTLLTFLRWTRAVER